MSCHIILVHGLPVRKLFVNFAEHLSHIGL